MYTYIHIYMYIFVYICIYIYTYIYIYSTHIRASLLSWTSFCFSSFFSMPSVLTSPKFKMDNKTRLCMLPPLYLQEQRTGANT